MRGLLFFSLCALLAGISLPVLSAPAVAIFYGPHPPLDELRAFDIAVVDPDQPGTDPQAYRRADSELFAYVSVGEVRPERPYYRKIRNDWKAGKNAAWGSELLDQSEPEWPAFFAEQVIAPLWAKGYRGFFLDTLDSYQLFAKTPTARAQQEAGLIAVVRELKRRWPEAKLIFNRGFEILPAVHEQAYMVAAESLFQGWNAISRSYVEVSAQDREWLLGQLKTVREQYRKPVLVIDYVAPENRELARATAKKIRQLGFIPWVSVPSLDALGVGEVEVLPRKVMIIYDPKDWDILQESAPQRFLAMPLAYLGLVVEYHSIHDPLPDFNLRGRYAGVISWINNERAAQRTAYPDWLQRQMRAGVPVVVFGAFGVSPESELFATLGLEYSDEPTTGQVRIINQNAAMGFEMPVRPRMEDVYPVRLKKGSGGQPWLTLGDAKQQFHPTAIMPWGGYALSPYTVENLPAKDLGERWYLNPLAFLGAALRLDTSAPVPDVTTESGRRLLMVHVDGDAFMSKTERPGYPFAGQVLLDDVLKRYTLPTTVSVIEGELSREGMYPDLAPKLEPIARAIFALPHVEIASHTYSHPFNWFKAETTTGDEGGYHLPIKGYHFDLTREIGGSVNYIRERLAPPGKPVKILLWSGNCVATPEAVEETLKAGVLNMNGGDTTITRRQNTWTRIAGLGMQKGEGYQVFAPNQNENVYTNLWHGPFYGYERVIETFDLTESPYRFKPVDIYYHLYAVTKTASFNALDKVYRWALAQPLHPVYASEYIRKVLDFNGYTVARTPTGYRLRGAGELRTVRLPAQGGSIDPGRSRGVVGLAPGPQGRYVSLAGGSAELVAGEPGREPYVVSANARLVKVQRQPGVLDFGLEGHQPAILEVAQQPGCVLTRNGNTLRPAAQGQGRQRYQFAESTVSGLRLVCRSRVEAGGVRWQGREDGNI